MIPLIQSLNIDEKTEKYLLSELKDYFFKKILDFVYCNSTILDKNELDQNIDNRIVIGGSGAIMDISENMSTILDYGKSFSDKTLVVTDRVDLILDYNSIKIQTISMEGFAPKMNLKFSFCLAKTDL